MFGDAVTLALVERKREGPLEPARAAYSRWASLTMWYACPVFFDSQAT
jgi:hypothetical protein